MKNNITFLTFTAITLLFLQVTACNSNATSGKSTESITLQLGSFTKIQLDGGYDVELVQGNEESITIETAKDKMDRVKTEIQDDKLKVWIDKGIQISKIKLTINFKNIEELEINGGISITSLQTIRFNSFLLKVNGGAEIKLDLDGRNLKLDLAGGTNTELKGKVIDANIMLGGAGNISAEKLESENMKIEIDGAGHAVVFASKSINAQLAGVGMIEYAGNPAIVKSDLSGIGSIRHKE